MEITPKAMEIEYIRIKRFNQKTEKAYATGLEMRYAFFLIPLTGYYFFQYLLLLNVITAERPD